MRYERTGEWRAPLQHEGYETQQGPRLAAHKETDYEFWILRYVPEPTSETERLEQRLLSRLQKFHDAFRQHVEAGGNPGDFQYPASNPVAEPGVYPPVYRTPEEVVSAIISELWTRIGNHDKRALQAILSRYRPESEAERMLDWLDRMKPDAFWVCGKSVWCLCVNDVHFNSGGNIRDAIRAAMAAEKGEQK